MGVVPADPPPGRDRVAEPEGCACDDHADVHRQPALDAAQYAAGDHQLLLISLVEVIPNPEARRARVREQHVSLGLFAGVPFPEQ